MRCLTPSTQQRVRPGGRAFRPPLRPRAGAPGPRGNSCVPGLPDHRTASCAEFAGRCLIGAPVPLSRHAQEGLDPRRRDPPGETAPVPAGGAQPGRSGPASRCGVGRQASRHSDDVLRRSTADGQVDRIVRVRVCPARRYVGPDERRGLGAAQAPRGTATRQWRRRRAQSAASAVATDSSPRSRRATIAGGGHQLARRRGTAAGCWACWRAMPCSVSSKRCVDRPRASQRRIAAAALRPRGTFHVAATSPERSSDGM